MEVNDEIVERQKLVTNDAETEEEPNSQVTTAPKSAPTPASPVAVPKINIKSISSGETTRSRNSATCSIERTTSDKGQTSAKVTYVNERRTRPHPSDERFEFKSRPRKLLKDVVLDDSSCSEQSSNSVTQLDTETITSSNNNNNNKNNPTNISNHNNNNDNNNHNNNNDNNNSNIIINNNESGGITTAACRRKRSNNGQGLVSLASRSAFNSSEYSEKFDDRPIKHHSFVSEVPDVKHMERALLGLLDDFHSGKLKAFGSGCTMEQMTKIREQQESLAKLHFELAAAEEDSLENGNDLNAAKAQENMLQLVQRLEQLSVSIEQLQTSHTGL